MKGLPDEWVDVLTESCKHNYSQNSKLGKHSSGHVYIFGDAESINATDVLAEAFSVPTAMASSIEDKVSVAVKHLKSVSHSFREHHDAKPLWLAASHEPSSLVKSLREVTPLPSAELQAVYADLVVQKYFRSLGRISLQNAKQRPMVKSVSDGNRILRPVSFSFRDDRDTKVLEEVVEGPSPLVRSLRELMLEIV